MNIYTRTGDQGTTSLADGIRVSKNDIRIETIGALDELNAHLGLLIALLDESEIISFLENIQHQLFSLGAILAYYPSLPPTALRTEFTPDTIALLEQAIDAGTASLPPQNSFILPSGCHAACQAHVCRTVCRRAERSVVSLLADDETDCLPLKYLNRLADYLFVLARKVNLYHDIAEKKWQKRCE